MKNYLLGIFATAAFVAGLISTPASNAQFTKTPVKGIPRTQDGKPDFTGVWAGPAFTHKVGPNDTEAPVPIVYDAKIFPALTPEGRAHMFRKATGNVAYDNPTGVCLPAGVMLEITSPYAQEWIQAPNYFVIRYEYQDNASRVIPLDGRPHPKDVEPTWMGNSVGKWEDDTLVIDTVGVKEWILDDKIHFPTPDADGSRWHSDALHIVERIRYTSATTASYQVTVDDPKYFTKPWTQEYPINRHPTWTLQEFVCAENNRCQAGKCVESDAQKSR